MSDDDEEGTFGGLYEDGHWVWDDITQALLFVSDVPPAHIETVQIAAKAPTGFIDFRDDIDLIEQLRYRRRYQRKLKPGQANVLTLQDIKDIALYTAPMSIMSPVLINMLHLPTTERFLRALIFCCAYYLQIADIMTARIKEQQTKVRTQSCTILEHEFRNNLADLRILVAKEYCIMLLGGGDMRKYHHMGPQKKRQSLSDKDARLFETFVRMSIQIVYLALGRKSFSQIELECQRLLKSEIFNTAEHNLKTGYILEMTPEERDVLIGPCVQQGKKLTTRSPLMNEVNCHRPIDFRLMGLGVIKYQSKSPRVQYLYHVVAAPEEALPDMNITVGIIGMQRSAFDTMLRPIPIQGIQDKSKSSVRSSQSTGMGRSGQGLARKSVQVFTRIYPEIIMPEKDSKELSLPSVFPENSEPIRSVSERQRRKWQNRFKKMTQPLKAV